MSAFVLGFSMLIFLFNVVYSLIFVRVPTAQNPWRSKSLEWQLPTPVPVNNFEQIPVFDSDPYAYGTPPLTVGGTARGGPRGRGRLSDGPAARKKPLGLQVPPVPHGVEIPPEPPDVGARALSVASRLLAGASVFFFLAFVFAYFYLRSLNVQHMWKPAHVKPDQALGAAFVACVVLSAARDVRRGRQYQARRALVDGACGSRRSGSGSVAIALQCVEYTVQKFGPTDGAYASVFCAWSAFYLLAALATMYWIETNLASELRARREPARSEGDIKDPDRLIAPGVDARSSTGASSAGIGVLTYVVLYLL